MNSRLNTWGCRVALIFGNKRFWPWLLAFFVFESVWLALSARYPMAFDENYHFGLIQLHAQQWLPYFTHQPAHSAMYGPVVRDPSYLYHWLMSLPYRLIKMVTPSQPAAVLVLRILNIALFAYGLSLYRKIFRLIGASQALTNSIMTVFILIPIVPFLAATINYDNMFFVCVAGTILLTLRLIQSISKKTVMTSQLLLLLSLLLLSSIVKYAFLPVAIACGVYVLFMLWKCSLLGSSGYTLLVRNFRATPRWVSIGLLVLCIVSAGLFAERYAQNLHSYHKPVPTCENVLTDEECTQYGPYGRDKLLSAEKPAVFHPGFVSYSVEWLYGMWYRLFFAVNFDYASASPLPVIGWLGAIGAFAIVGTISLRFKQIFARQPGRQLILVLVLTYTSVLFVQGFQSYSETAQPVAINGRYLLPFIPFVFYLACTDWARLLIRYPAVKGWIAAGVLSIFLLQGGGTMTFVVRSWDYWLWDNRTVQTVNHMVRDSIWSVIIRKDIQFVSP